MKMREVIANAMFDLTSKCLDDDNDFEAVRKTITNAVVRELKERKLRRLGHDAGIKRTSCMNVGCKNITTEDDYCHGCGYYICWGCDLQRLTIGGTHHVTQHWEDIDAQRNGNEQP